MSDRTSYAIIAVCLIFIGLTFWYRSDKREWERECRAAHGLPIEFKCLRVDTLPIPWPPVR